jgi:hypothetical protein
MAQFVQIIKERYCIGFSILLYGGVPKSFVFGFQLQSEIDQIFSGKRILRQYNKKRNRNIGI